MSRKSKKVADPQPVAPLGDWRDDWLYSLVLRDAEYTWACRKREMQMMDDVDESPYWQYVLVEEYGDSEDSMCRGDREITDATNGRRNMRHLFLRDA